MNTPFDDIAPHPVLPCVLDPEFFFPDERDCTGIAAAKAECRACPEVDACLAGALERNEKFGVWGASTPAERERMRRRGR